MKHILCLFVLGAITTNALGASYELRLITVAHRGNKSEWVHVRCHTQPDVTIHRSEIGGIESESRLPMQVNAEAVQKLVDAARGIPAPDYQEASKMTAWWVRSTPTDAFKLLRAVVEQGGKSTVFADQADAARQLAVFMSANCFRSFEE